MYTYLASVSKLVVAVARSFCLRSACHATYFQIRMFNKCSFNGDYYSVWMAHAPYNRTSDPLVPPLALSCAADNTSTPPIIWTASPTSESSDKHYVNIEFLYLFVHNLDGNINADKKKQPLSKYFLSYNWERTILCCVYTRKCKIPIHASELEIGVYLRFCLKISLHIHLTTQTSSCVYNRLSGNNSQTTD